MTSEDEPANEDAYVGLEVFPEGAGEPAPSPGSLLGAVGQMAAAVLAVVLIVALLVGAAVALRRVFWG